MMNAGDTGFMLICTAFVFFMTPGLAFFYGGLVRRKNVVNTMMACGAIMGLSVVMWTLFGYSLAFGGNHGGIIGDLRWFALNGVGWEPGPYADTIPHLVFVAFQMMFAMITPALITGAVVETSYNPTAKFPQAFIERKDVTYSYEDGDLYHFMDNETYDDIPVNASDVPDNF